ncbi:MAG: MarR family transcriptional regulator [Pseudomonadota bacterium]
MAAVQHCDESVSKERLRLWLRMLRLTRHMESRLRDRLRTEFDTTLPRFDVLSALDRNADGLLMSELSRVLIVSNGNVTGIVERLVTDGLVERAAVPGDRRASRVRLTRAGRTVFAEQAARHEGWVDALLSATTPEEAALLGTILRRQSRVLEEERVHDG